MKTLLSDFTISGVSIELDENVLILRYGEKIFDIFFDLEARDSYLDLLKAINYDPDIKVVLTLNEHGCLGDEPYERYIKKLSGQSVPVEIEAVWNVHENLERARQLNFHHYTIEQRLKSKKIMVDGLQGTVVTPFFGESLSADIRFVSEDFKFSLAHKKYGIHPTGGLPFFLPRYVGQGKANEILLATDVIDAKTALDLGLVTRIIPNEDFESSSIQAAKELACLSPVTVSLSKLLSFRDKQSLQDYFEFERNHFK
ncbi:MAG: hypothetical protein DRR06_07965 [Gammaproteobacteria bacterium]|nr:MAG: hypothetical protein DRQ48_06590 [Gammaproteobacteria bacterium]RLA45130.1 MAG: hypothetical protein DRR06_07965 [Gammaproteobacteria bacterium]